MLRRFTTAYAGSARPLGPGAPLVRPAGPLARAAGDECGREGLRKVRGAPAPGRANAHGQSDTSRSRFATGGHPPFGEPGSAGHGGGERGST